MIDLMEDNKKAILDTFSNMQVWSKGNERAPHKPLLILLAIAEMVKRNERFLLYSEIEQPLKTLLKNFGPTRAKHHPEYPFFRLQKDEIWEISVDEPIHIKSGRGDATPKELKNKNAAGGFTKPIFDALQKDKTLVENIAKAILEQNFPESLHEEILNEIGLSFSKSQPSPYQAQFRTEVLRAYGRKCAICNFDIKLGIVDFGLEAAHIKWRQAGGPNEVSNGLALCTIHHKALDRGAIGLNSDLTVLVSAEIHGNSGFSEWFLNFKGKQINLPTRLEWHPLSKFTNWHLNEVFKHPQQD
jgi:putative restriction endonuclease